MKVELELSEEVYEYLKKSSKEFDITLKERINGILLADSLGMRIKSKYEVKDKSE